MSSEVSGISGAIVSRVGHREATDEDTLRSQTYTVAPEDEAQETGDYTGGGGGGNGGHHTGGGTGGDNGNTGTGGGTGGDSGNTGTGSGTGGDSGNTGTGRRQRQYRNRRRQW